MKNREKLNMKYKLILLILLSFVVVSCSYKPRKVLFKDTKYTNMTNVSGINNIGVYIEVNESEVGQYFNKTSQRRIVKKIVEKLSDKGVMAVPILIDKIPNELVQRNFYFLNIRLKSYRVRSYGNDVKYANVVFKIALSMKKTDNEIHTVWVSDMVLSQLPPRRDLFNTYDERISAYTTNIAEAIISKLESAKLL